MKTWSFTTEFDACLSKDIINTIYELYQHKKKNILPSLESIYGLNDVCLIDKQSYSDEKAPNLTKVIQAVFSGNPDIDLQYITSTLPDTSTQEKTFIIIFKGSKERADWIANFAIQKADFFDSGVKVHLGFQKTIELFEDSFKEHCAQHTKDIFSELYSSLNNENTKIILAGHSLGGSLATLAACRFHDLGVLSRNLAVYSFGAPPIGSKEFVQKYKDKFAIYRFTNTLDIIPRSEKILSWSNKHRLSHLGNEIILPSNEWESHSIHGYIDNIDEYAETKK